MKAALSRLGPPVVCGGHKTGHAVSGLMTSLPRRTLPPSRSLRQQTQTMTGLRECEGKAGLEGRKPAAPEEEVVDGVDTATEGVLNRHNRAFCQAFCQGEDRRLELLAGQRLALRARFERCALTVRARRPLVCYSRLASLHIPTVFY